MLFNRQISGLLPLEHGRDAFPIKSPHWPGTIHRPPSRWTPLNYLPLNRSWELRILLEYRLHSPHSLFCVPCGVPSSCLPKNYEKLSLVSLTFSTIGGKLEIKFSYRRISHLPLSSILSLWFRGHPGSNHARARHTHFQRTWYVSIDVHSSSSLMICMKVRYIIYIFEIVFLWLAPFIKPWTWLWVPRLLAPLEVRWVRTAMLWSSDFSNVT